MCKGDARNIEAEEGQLRKACLQRLEQGGAEQMGTAALVIPQGRGGQILVLLEQSSAMTWVTEIQVEPRGEVSTVGTIGLLTAPDGSMPEGLSRANRSQLRQARELLMDPQASVVSRWVVDHYRREEVGE